MISAGHRVRFDPSRTFPCSMENGQAETLLASSFQDVRQRPRQLHWPTSPGQSFRVLSRAFCQLSPRIELFHLKKSPQHQSALSRSTTSAWACQELYRRRVASGAFHCLLAQVRQGGSAPLDCARVALRLRPQEGHGAKRTSKIPSQLASSDPDRSKKVVVMTLTSCCRTKYQPRVRDLPLCAPGAQTGPVDLALEPRRCESLTARLLETSSKTARLRVETDEINQLPGPTCPHL